jgi:hypothetical protein
MVPLWSMILGIAATLYIANLVDTVETATYLSLQDNVIITIISSDFKRFIGMSGIDN